MMWMWYTKWKAKRELRKASYLIERLADELPSYVLKQLYPELEPGDAASRLHFAAQRMKSISRMR